MTETAGKASSWLVVVALALAGTASIPMVVASRPDSSREVRLVVRDMTFYVDGDSSPNPTLRFRRGEQIRLVLRNEDQGMTHDVAIRAWHVGMPKLSRAGEHEVRFRVPNTAGETAYLCTPHPEMMRGIIIVE